MGIIKIRIADAEANEVDHTPVGVECWYDPHFRHWVVYPVDAEGNQLDEARYGFGKREANQIKKDIERQIANGERFNYYD